MLPDEVVLVVYVPTPEDFAILFHEGWYRLPVHRAPRALLAPVYAFYFGRAFGDRGHAIHYYARRHGHELVTRQMLFPQQLTHPRALQPYYKLQFGPLHALRRSIGSPRWRRLLFAQTTWDRLVHAKEIGELFHRGSAADARRPPRRPADEASTPGPTRRQ